MTMTVATKADSKASQPPVRRGHAAPAIVLLLLAPIIGEVLSGATRLWIPMAAGIGWGVAAFVMIRTWVRAPGWGALHDGRSRSAH